MVSTGTDRETVSKRHVPLAPLAIFGLLFLRGFITVYGCRRVMVEGGKKTDVAGCVCADAVSEVNNLYG